MRNTAIRYGLWNKQEAGCRNHRHIEKKYEIRKKSISVFKMCIHSIYTVCKKMSSGLFSVD